MRIDSVRRSIARWRECVNSCLAALIVVRLQGRQPTGGESTEDAALEVLRQRYDRGGINKEEFEATKRGLVLRAERFAWPLEGGSTSPD
jgi:hypothetical protein